MFWHSLTGPFLFCAFPVRWEKIYIKMTFTSEMKNIFIMFAASMTFTYRVETPFFLQGALCGHVRWQDTQIGRTILTARLTPKRNAKGNASSNNPNNPAVAKHVNTALRHVIRSSVCKHASKACDSADDILRSRRTANQKTGVCELGGASL